MKARPYCPNTLCEYHLSPPAQFSIKKGYYVTRWNHQKVARYQCRKCKKKFSSHTFYRIYRQKKPFLNAKVFHLYCSATTQRRIAFILGINVKTVVRKFLFLAKHAEELHLNKLLEKAFDVQNVQFDEMLSFEHTRLKPLSIALAVEKGTYRVVALKVAESHYQGRLASIALRKYGPRMDKSHEARHEVLNAINSQLKSSCAITTDEKPHYRNEVCCIVPRAELCQVKNRGSRLERLLKARRRNIKDDMFELNLVAAKIRHDLSRMARKVWVTTKRADRLQKHLMLFVAFHNGYPISTFRK
ncbi:MAG: hypothetical protein ACKN9V_07040 [Pseudomonadota bacterium]